MEITKLLVKATSQPQAICNAYHNDPPGGRTPTTQTDPSLQTALLKAITDLNQTLKVCSSKPVTSSQEPTASNYPKVSSHWNKSSHMPVSPSSSTVQSPHWVSYSSPGNDLTHHLDTDLQSALLTTMRDLTEMLQASNLKPTSSHESPASSAHSKDNLH